MIRWFGKLLTTQQPNNPTTSLETRNVRNPATTTCVHRRGSRASSVFWGVPRSRRRRACTSSFPARWEDDLLLPFFAISDLGLQISDFQSEISWWSRRGSNPQPSQCHCDALPIAPRPRNSPIRFLTTRRSHQSPRRPKNDAQPTSNNARCRRPYILLAFSRPDSF